MGYLVYKHTSLSGKVYICNTVGGFHWEYVKEVT